MVVLIQLLNFDSRATIDDGSCNYYLSNHDNLFFSEWGEGKLLE